MIFKASFKISKNLDRSKYLVCFIAKKIPKGLSCDYLFRDFLPPLSLYRLKESNEITENEFNKRYVNYLKSPLREFSISDIMDSLHKTSEILSKDIVLCGESLCNIVCNVIEEVTKEKIQEISIN